MVEIDIDFCLGIRLYGSPRKQNVDFFLAANTVKTISAHWNKDTKMVSREFRADFWTLAKMVNYSLRFVILGDMLASKNHCEFIRCVCALQSWISLFGADPLQVSGFLALDIPGTILVWWASLKHVVMVNATKWGYFIEHKPGTSVHTLLDCFNTLAVDSTIYGMFC